MIVHRIAQAISQTLGYSVVVHSKKELLEVLDEYRLAVVEINTKNGNFKYKWFTSDESEKNKIIEVVGGVYDN